MWFLVATYASMESVISKRSSREAKANDFRTNRPDWLRA